MLNANLDITPKIETETIVMIALGIALAGIMIVLAAMLARK